MLFCIYFHIISCADFFSSKGLQIPSVSVCLSSILHTLKKSMFIHDTLSTEIKGREAYFDQILTTTIAFLLQI